MSFRRDETALSATHHGDIERQKYRTSERFLSPFGDMTLWNILASCVVLPYISPYSWVINLMLWVPIPYVAPETLSLRGGGRFRLDTGHYRPDPLVTRCHAAAP